MTTTRSEPGFMHTREEVRRLQGKVRARSRLTRRTQARAQFDRLTRGGIEYLTPQSLSRRRNKCKLSAAVDNEGRRSRRQATGSRRRPSKPAYSHYAPLC